MENPAQISRQKMLEERVKETALEVCKEIGRQYPQLAPDDAICAKLAAKKAMVKV
ncbi:MAG: hypothetical protein WCE48_12820 [Steroidobacteraceae bacterium]